MSVNEKLFEDFGITFIILFLSEITTEIKELRQPQNASIAPSPMIIPDHFHHLHLGS